MQRLVAISAICALAAAAPAAAQKRRSEPTPAPIQRLLDCRAIADVAQRLACFDRESRTVSESFARRDLVAFDRERVRSTKRSLFGLAIPNLGIFDDEEENEIKQIDSTVAGVGFNSEGGYIIRLADGSRWSQTDTKKLALDPRAGDKVVVKRGALGSYLLRVGKMPGFKVRRVN